MTDEVPCDEEIRGEFHVGDNAEFIPQPVNYFVWQLLTPTPFCALESKMLEVFVVGGELRWEREVR